MTDQKNYEINFFKPLSEHAKSNTKLISILAIVWALAVFGFHIVLIIVSTPTAEETLNKFDSVWPQVVDDSNATLDMHQEFTRSVLMVLGKNIAVSDNHKIILKEFLNWSVTEMQSDSLKPIYKQAAKEEKIEMAAASIGLDDSGFDKILRDLLPTALLNNEFTKLASQSKKVLPEIMNLYLVHNQSFLTDFNFFGFPFHYWYTAQFLLILFVVLCLIYAVIIDKLNKTHEVVEET